AVNTVLRRLFREGIRPDLVVAADQYIQMREHIEGIGDQTEGIPMIAERRTNWQYTERYLGPICFVSTENNSEDKEEDIWEVSGSVAGLALEAAVRLGAGRIYLVGQDLAYPDGKTYAQGMPYVAEAESRGTMLVPSVNGGMVSTSEAFHWFRIGLETQIAKYKDIRFINLSRQGARIKGCVDG
ncbi:MAG: motility associated factor glycosyltransferase family protein, partial [Lachnospiraceae bacterium]|nr:motility associated factor glycosyltransferase family protein [Lachnospiraceae bacterium]